MPVASIFTINPVYSPPGSAASIRQSDPRVPAKDRCRARKEVRVFFIGIMYQQYR
jgi:hypothetical protein